MCHWRPLGLKIRAPQNNLMETLLSNSLAWSQTWWDLYLNSGWLLVHSLAPLVSTVVTVLFFLLKRNTYSELAYVCKHSFGFFLAVCLHFPPLYTMEQGGLSFCSILHINITYSPAVVMIRCAVLCCNSHHRMRWLLTDRIILWWSSIIITFLITFHFWVSIQLSHCCQRKQY